MLVAIKNYGTKTGKLRRYWVRHTFGALPPVFWTEGVEWRKAPVPIQGTESYTLDMVQDRVLNELGGGEVLQNPDDHPHRFRIYGEARYDDGFGNERVLRFSRAYSHELSTRRGKPTMEIHSGDPDGYNEAD